MLEGVKKGLKWLCLTLSFLYSQEDIPSKNLQENPVVEKPTIEKLKKLNGIIPYKKYFFSIITQNDSYFNVFIDRYYTAGHGFMYSSKEGSYGFLDRIGLVQGVTSFSVALNQSIYTPKDRLTPQPPSDEHPYGGYLNVGLFLHHRSNNSLENFSLRLGMVGEASFAEETQGFIHDLIGSVILRGWSGQIQNEFVINLHYDYTYRYNFVNYNGFEMDMLPTLDLAVGNANIYLKGGVVLRMGHHLGSTFLSQGVAGENGGGNTGRVYANGIGYYVFLGSYGGYVMRKIFIQGNSFKHSQAELVPWVGGAVAGISIVSGVMSFTYSAYYMSKEFRTQDQAHGAGSFAFSWSF